MSSRAHGSRDQDRAFLRRAGVTLVELMVVIGIIGVLVGLLLPAVQAARESARRVICGNHVKEIALAAQNYENVNQQLPRGTVTMMFCRSYSPPQGTTKDARNWGQLLLPYLEHQQLYDKVVATLPNDTSEWTWNLVPETLTPVQTFQCPSDPNAAKRAMFLDANPPAERGFFSNYRGVAGSTVFNPNASSDTNTLMNAEVRPRPRLRRPRMAERGSMVCSSHARRSGCAT